ncbi:MAG TPA: BatA and WFA domain-containing protein [Pirellulaceae bacterium]|nr:BatA and WFA domain-containing protein [Pirellulaceae bacterium]
MAFINLSLLAGGLCVAIPVVLHLIMRQRPKQFIFPALRFIQQRRIANQRRLQLRHWLLLALRCGAIGLFALALARPSVTSGTLSSWIAAGFLGAMGLVAGVSSGVGFARNLSRLVAGTMAAVAAILLVMAIYLGGRAAAGRPPVLGDQEAPVAAVLVIDTSPRMQYRSENRTRLAAAQEMAHWLIRQLPGESELAVVDSRSGSGAFAVDRAAAEKAIERLRPVGTPRPLAEVLEHSVQLVRQKPQPRKEIYVFTDLTQAAWKTTAADGLKKLLADHPGVLLYVLDVGAENPRNFALGPLTLSADVLPAGADLKLETSASASGVSGERSVELQIETPDPTLPVIRDGQPVFPKSQRRGVSSVKLEPGGQQQVQFTVSGLPAGVHQGLVRLVGEDGLALDDVRYFAVEVQPAWPVLVVAPADVSPRLFIEMLAPLEQRESGRARFKCDAIDQARLADAELADYRAVVLLDPKPLTPDLWKKLAEFCQTGGGLAVFLGHNADPPASFQDPAAVAVLGGKLTRVTRTGGDIYLAPRSYDHPALAAFRPVANNVPWDLFPVFYHWNLDNLAATARSIVPFGDGKPALVENRLGRGSALVMTTPVSDLPRPVDHPLWNDLAAGENIWPCVLLVHESMTYLVRSGQTRLNLLAGETAVLPNDPAEFPERYQLFTPLEQPQDVLARDRRVTVRFTDNPGAYRLRGQKGGPLVRGFAVNLAGDTSDLSRLPREKLDELLGAKRFQLARSQDELNRAVGNDRIGSEFYPLLIALVAVALGLEHVLANRFYRKDD